jgi:hypothetical protein
VGESGLLEYESASLGDRISTFRDNVVSSSSRIETSSCDPRASDAWSAAKTSKLGCNDLSVPPASRQFSRLERPVAISRRVPIRPSESLRAVGLHRPQTNPQIDAVEGRERIVVVFNRRQKIRLKR